MRLQLSPRRLLEAAFCLAVGGVLLWIPHKLKQPGPLHNKLLVATRQMQGGFFDHGVILVLNQNTYGATGLLLNRPMPEAGSPYRIGGPVEPKVIYTLHTLDLYSRDTYKMEELDVGATKGNGFPELIHKMGDRPKQHILFKGYTSWGLGQLQQEVNDGKWTVLNPTSEFMFRTAPAAMWDTAQKMPALTLK